MITIYTSSRDHQFTTSFGSQMPVDTRYVRVLVVATKRVVAEESLHAVGLGRYAETLRPATGADRIADAVRAHAETNGLGIYLVYRVDTAGSAPAFHVGWLSHLDLIEYLGWFTMVDREYGTVCIMPGAGLAVPDGEALPAAVPDGEALPAAVVDGDLDQPQQPAQSPSVARSLLGAAERRLDDALADAVDDLTEVIARVDRVRSMSTDRRVRWHRASDEVAGIIGRLAEALATARQIEVLGDVVDAEEQNPR